MGYTDEYQAALDNSELYWAGQAGFEPAQPPA